MGAVPSLRNGLIESGQPDGEVPASLAAPKRADPPTPGPTPAHHVLHTDATNTVACLGPCVLVISHTLTLPAVEAIGRAFATIVQRQQKLCALSIVDSPPGPGADPAARDAVAELTRQHNKHITGAAIVCDGTGFRATAVRSMVTSIHMASRSSHPSKVFATTGPALDWLQSTRPTRDLDLPLLAQAVATLRAHWLEQLARAGVQPGV